MPLLPDGKAKIEKLSQIEVSPKYQSEPPLKGRSLRARRTGLFPDLHLARFEPGNVCAARSLEWLHSLGLRKHGPWANYRATNQSNHSFGLHGEADQLSKAIS
jgi:hypothetical protein